MEKELYEYYEQFEQEYESYKNGNISDFKNFLHKLKGEEVFIFIKWLQAERLKL